MIPRKDLEDLLITIKESVNIPNLKYEILDDGFGKKLYDKDVNYINFQKSNNIPEGANWRDYEFSERFPELSKEEIGKLKKEIVFQFKHYTDVFKFNYALEEINEDDFLQIRINNLFPPKYELDRIFDLIGNGATGNKLRYEPVKELYTQDDKKIFFIYTAKRIDHVDKNLIQIKRELNRYYNLKYEVTGYSDGTEIYIRQA